jgi:hypothetical protein
MVMVPSGTTFFWTFLRLILAPVEAMTLPPVTVSVSVRPVVSPQIAPGPPLQLTEIRRDAPLVFARPTAGVRLVPG